MSAKHSQYAVCSIADAALSVPDYKTLKKLRVAQWVAEQPVTRANHAGDEGFAKHVLGGERLVAITLEGFSDASEGEMLLKAGFFSGALCRLRFDTAQTERISGLFSVTRFSQEARADTLEAIRVDLRSYGVVTFAS